MADGYLQRRVFVDYTDAEVRALMDEALAADQ